MKKNKNKRINKHPWGYNTNARQLVSSKFKGQGFCPHIAAPNMLKIYVHATIPFSSSVTFITPSEKHSISLSASLSSHGFIIVISGRSLYEAVAVNKPIKKKKDTFTFAC